MNVESFRNNGETVVLIFRTSYTDPMISPAVAPIIRGSQKIVNMSLGEAVVKFFNIL